MNPLSISEERLSMYAGGRKWCELGTDTHPQAQVTAGERGTAWEVIMGSTVKLGNLGLLC